MRFGRSGFAMKWRPNADQAGDAVRDGGLRRVRLEPAGRDDRPLEDLSQLLCSDRPHAFGDQIVALDPGLDEVEIGEVELIEALSDVAEQIPWVTVGHSVERAASAQCARPPDRRP